MINKRKSLQVIFSFVLQLLAIPHYLHPIAKTQAIPGTIEQIRTYEKTVRTKLIELYQQVLKKDIVSPAQEEIITQQLKQATDELEEINSEIASPASQTQQQPPTPTHLSQTIQQQALPVQQASLPQPATQATTISPATPAIAKDVTIIKKAASTHVTRAISEEKKQQEQSYVQSTQALEQALATEQKKPLQVTKKSTIDIPHFGTITVKEKNKKLTPVFNSKTVTIGALNLTDIDIKINAKKQLFINAQASIMGLSGKCSLTSQQENAFLFTIALDNPVFILTSPSNEVAIEELQVSLTNEHRQLFAKSTGFSEKEAVITFDIEGKSPHGTIKLDTLTIPDFLTGQKDRSLVINNSLITIEQALTGQFTTTVIEGNSTLETFYPEVKQQFTVGDNKVILTIPDFNAFELLFSAQATFNAIEGELFLEKVDGNNRTFSFFPSVYLTFPTSIYEEGFINNLELKVVDEKTELYAKTAAYNKEGNPDTVIKLSTDKNNTTGTISLDELNLQDLMGDEATKTIIIKKPTITIANLTNPNIDNNITIAGKTDLTNFLSIIPGKPTVNDINITASINYQEGFQTTLQFADQITFIPQFCYLKKPSLHIKRPLGTPEDLEQLKANEQMQDAMLQAGGQSVTQLASQAKILTKAQQAAAPLAKKGAKALKMAQVALRSEILLTGTLEAEINGIGKLSVDINGPFIGGKLLKIEGNLKQELNFFDKVKLGGTKLEYFVPEKLGRISVTASVLGFDVIGSVDFKTVLNPTTNVTEKHTIFTARPKQQTFKPFDATNVPGLDDISLQDLLIGYNMKTKTFFIEGAAKVLNFQQRVQVAITKVPSGPNAGKKLVNLRLELQDNFKLSQPMPFLKGTPFDALTFSKTAIVVSSSDYFDEELGIRINKGFNIAARIKRGSGPLDKALDLFKGLPDNIILQGSIGSSLKDVKLKVVIPIELRMSDKATLKQAGIELITDGFGFSLFGQMEVRPTTKDEPLFFTIRGNIKAAQASIAGTMEGMWRNPLGIKGFAVGNVALEVGIDYPVFMSTGLPSTFGIAGSVDIGGIQASMATKISANLADIILLGKLNELGIHNIIKMVNGAGANIPLDKVPNLAIKDVEIKFAPKGGTIGELVFDPGLTYQGKIQIADKWAMISINADYQGIIAKGGLSELKLGPLEITGAGFDKKYGTADDGPTISLELTAQKQEFFLSGLIELLGTKSQTEVYIRPTKYEFMTHNKLLGLFETKIEGYAEIKKDPDFWIKGTFKNDFYDFIKREVTQELNKFQKKAEEDLNKAKQEVDKINKAMDEATGKVRNARQKVQDEEDKVKKLDNRINELKRLLASNTFPPFDNQLMPIDTTFGAIRLTSTKLTNRNVFESFINQSYQLSSLENDYSQKAYIYSLATSPFAATLTVDDYQVLFVWNPFKKSSWEKVGNAVKDTAKKVGNGISNAAKKTAEFAKKQAQKVAWAAELAGLYTARTAALAALKVAQGAMIAAEGTVKGTLTAARESAKASLDAANFTAKGISEVGKLIAANIGGSIKIKRAVFECKLNDLKTAKLPSLLLDAELLGKEIKEAKFQLDLKRPDLFIENLVQLMIKIVKP